MLPARLPLLALLCLLCANAQAEAPLFSTDGYRISLYRSPTPAQAPGATIVDTPALQALLTQTPAPVLIDVYRRQYLQGRFIEASPTPTCPAATGWPIPATATSRPNGKATFARHLYTFTGGRPDAAVGLLLPLRLLVELERGKTSRQPGLYLGVLVSRWPGCMGSGETASDGCDTRALSIIFQNHNKKVNGHVQNPDCRRSPAVSRGDPQRHQRRLSRQRSDGNRRPRQRPRADPGPRRP